MYSSSGLQDAGQWALTVGLGTLVPGFALFKLFTVTGAVEAERGAEEELARHRRHQEVIKGRGLCPLLTGTWLRGAVEPEELEWKPHPVVCAVGWHHHP